MGAISMTYFFMILYPLVVLSLTVLVIWLLFRLVKATERIADSVENSSKSDGSDAG